jgi:glutamate receptor, ionotropic, invertebrate
MDERWESEIIEYGAINITGFRILDTHKRNVREFLEGWRKLDTASWIGAGRDSISGNIQPHYSPLFLYLLSFN